MPNNNKLTFIRLAADLQMMVTNYVFKNKVCPTWTIGSTIQIVISLCTLCKSPGWYLVSQINFIPPMGIFMLHALTIYAATVSVT